MLSVALLSYRQMALLIEEISIDKMNEILRQININIEHSTTECQKEIRSFLKNKYVERFSIGYRGENNDILALVKRSIVDLKDGSDYFIDARFFAADGGDTDHNVFPLFMLDFHPDKAMMENLEYVWTSVSDQSWNRFAYFPAIYCYVRDKDEVITSPGIWRFDINADKIFEVVRTMDFGRNGIVMVVKDNGSLIYFNNSSDAVWNHRDVLNAIKGTKGNEGHLLLPINENEYFISYNRANSLGWHVTGIIPRSELRQEALRLRNYIILLSLVFSVLLIVVITLSIRTFTKRTKKLAATIDQFGKGNFTVSYETAGVMDEIGELGEQFNRMMSRILRLIDESEQHHQREKTLINENLTLEIMKRQAELEALQNQINPHFLFNTFEMLKGMFYEEGSKSKTIMVVQALSDMFRYNMNKNSLVRLEEELNHIRDYMFIQNARFGDKIHLQIDIPPEFNDMRALRFSFEPIVENSIKHGFRDMEGELIIRISAEITDETLFIKIWDNGCGIGEAELADMNRMMRTDIFEGKSGGGLGVYNVNARLRKEYGVNFGLKYESAPGKGTTVYILHSRASHN
jgi:two-component system sensor histidine kinase YesM